MQLQQLISKFVLLAMLFTVFSTSVNANLLHPMPMADAGRCHAMSAALSCCSEREITSQHIYCHSEAIEAQTANSSSCCPDSDCHTNSMQVAIISSFNAISIPSAALIFTEPAGKRMYFYEVRLRPPVFS